MIICLVNLLDSWASGATGTWRSSSSKIRHATIRHATSTCCLVHLHHDWIHHTFDLLLLGLELVLLDVLLVAILKLVLEFLLLQRVAHGEAVILQAVLGLDFALVGLVFSPVLFGLADHAVNLRLRQATLLI